MEQMPLRERLEEIRARDLARFYMPGHKGHLPAPLEAAAPYDITEIETADSLYACTGPLRELERQLSGAVGSADALLSAGGSTLCIQAMLFLARSRGRGILAARNAHRSAVAAMGLLGLTPQWLTLRQPASSGEGIPGVPLPPSPEAVENALYEYPDLPTVYITSPDYYGQIADISGIADVCRRHGAMLLVDNAHGAHLGCFRVALHPIALGADLCCDSLHKTLPCLTGGAVLHLADAALYEDAKHAMSLFGSTSPSYLIMLSCENALAELKNPGNRWLELSARIDALRETARKKGYLLTQTWMRDPVRLTLGFASLGYTADSFGAYLRKMGVEPEYVGGCAAVFLASPCNSEADFSLLERAIQESGAGRTPCEPAPVPTLPLPRRRMSISQAMASPAAEVPVGKALGRVAARMVTTCPPCVPLTVPGEEIGPNEVNFLKSCGIDTVSVIK